MAEDVASEMDSIGILLPTNLEIQRYRAGAWIYVAYARSQTHGLY